MEFLQNIEYSHLQALFSVIMIDIAMSADNGIVIALAVQAIPAHKRKKVIAIGVILATLLRVVFALLTAQLLQIPGIMTFGGALLFYVCYKMYKDLRRLEQEHHAESKSDKEQSYWSAVYTIIAADISMSLDNVLAVAGASSEHPYIMIFGLGLSIVMMAVLSNSLSKLMNKYKIIGYIGLAIIFYVAIKMVYHDYDNVLALIQNLRQ